MSPVEDAALRAAAASAPGYACYPGITPPGNPRRIVLPPVSWARTVDNPRPLAEITPTQPIPPLLDAQPRRRPARLSTPPGPATDPGPGKRVAACGYCIEVPTVTCNWVRVSARRCPVHGVDAQQPPALVPPATAAEIATAPPPEPGGHRRWWHYLTARRMKETQQQ